MNKICFKCGASKDLDNFYKHSEMADGHLNKCKECTKKDARMNYIEHRFEFARYDIERNQREERKRSRYEHTKRRRELRPDRYLAHTKVNNAVKRGKLKISDCCQQCQSNAKLEAHHEDYSKPLDVVWLCRRCHLERHGKKDYNSVLVNAKTNIFRLF